MGETPPVSHPIPQDFKDAVTELLFQSQMIEQMLKAVLQDIHDIAELALKARIKFRYEVKEDKRTLGQLLRAYRVHALDEALVDRLEAFTRQRNQAAHTAYVWGYIHAENDEIIRETTATVHEHIEEAKALLELVTQESIRLYGLKQEYH